MGIIKPLIMCCVGSGLRHEDVILSSLLYFLLYGGAPVVCRGGVFSPLTRACYIDRSRRNHFLTRPNSWSVLTSKMVGEYDSQEYDKRCTAKYTFFSS